VPEGTSTDKGAIGKASPIEGDDQATNSCDQLFVELHREKEEEHVVREDGNNKGVDIEDAIGKGERADDLAMGC
jgi:hypothetical protein